MQEKTQQILQDLYNLDPHFKQHEEQLIRIIAKLLESKPNTKFDQAFAENLRYQLTQSMQMPVPKPAREEIISIRHQLVRRLSFAAGLVAVFLVIAATTLYVNRQNGNQLSIFTPGIKITSAGERAFGELDSASVDKQTTESSEKANSESKTEEVAKPEEPPLPSVFPPLPTPQEYSKIYPVYQPTYYKYVYKGDPLVLTEDKRPVLKRQKGDTVSYDLNGILNNLGVGLINLRSFNNSKLQSLTLSEEGNGYTLTLDAQNGSINIYSNWPMGVAETCSSNFAPCSPQPLTPLTPADVPDDATLVSMADEFLAAHNVPLLAYAPGEVTEWRTYYELSKKQGYPYLPEIVTVVYPLEINDQVVLDESGNKTGIMVGIDIRNKRVSSVYDLTAQSYQSSMYDAIKDVTKIMQIAERGGVYGYFPPECSSPPFTPDGRPAPPLPVCKVVEVELGAPKVELVKMWNYKDNQSQELLIPSVVFPINNPPAELSYRKAVVIPLIKEILENQQGPYMGERGMR